MNDKLVIDLQTWWIGELKRITKKVMDEEKKRQDRVRVKNDTMLGEYQTETDIYDAYGMGMITERKFNKLMDLLHERENVEQPGELYQLKLDLLSELFQIANGIIRDRKALQHDHD